MTTTALQKNVTVAVFKSHQQAREAVKQLQQAGFDGCHRPLAQVHGIRLGHRPLKHGSLDLQTGVTS